MSAIGMVSGHLNKVVFSARVLLVLAVLLPCLWVLVLVAPRRRVHRVVQRWARLALAAGGCRPVVSGLHHLDGHGSHVMIANHSSFLDSLLLMATVPGDYCFVVNHLAATRPLLGRVIRKAGYLIVDRRSMRARAVCVRMMANTLRARGSLLLFPEGTRAPLGVLPFKLGAFRVAAASASTVIPIAVRGTRQMMPRRIQLLTPGPLEVDVLSPIVCTSDRRDARALRDAAWSAINVALDRSVR